MRRILLSAIAGLSMLFAPNTAKAEKGDSIWFDYTNKFALKTVYDVSGCDSIEFKNAAMRVYKKVGNVSFTSKSYIGSSFGNYTFSDPGRSIAKPSTYGTLDFDNEDSQFCFKRSAESEHFIVFWEKGLTKLPTGNITYNGYTCNVSTILRDADKIWKCYVEELGFITPGKSTTDDVKIEMFIVKTASDGNSWRADGSGVDGTVYNYNGVKLIPKSHKVGVFHCTPRAAVARNGHTTAHEIGHTFQFLVSADLGQSHGMNYVLGTNSSGNEWWEDCANWQAYKVYPSYQFSDGEYYEGYLTRHHLNIHHEDARYYNCFYQDYWCQLHGKTTVGRVWRESNKPEDPSQAYMRIFGLDVAGYADEMYQAYAHLASIDIDGVRSYGKAKIGSERQNLKEAPSAILSTYLDNDNSWWVVDPDYCPQNFGYNANPLKVPAAGTVVKATFKGLAGCDGYRKVKTNLAGWRYGIVAYCSDGTRVYSDAKSDKDGEVSLTVPEKCTNMWFVVMGAPTEYWVHSWNGDVSDDEQWPYAVKFEGTDAYGASKTYGNYAEDYARKDTTVVINASLAYNSGSYTSVRVQYDMDAVSKALGVSTAQMKAVTVGKVSGKKNYLRFAGINANGTTETNKVTTSTSSSTVFGHWFNSSGNVCDYGGSSYIFAEMYPDSYGCYVGQYPGRLQKNKKYSIRQAFIYTDAQGKEYKAIMQVNLTVL